MESRMRLVAAAGHDLRTPITRMRLRAEFVEDDEDRARWLTDLDELERIADSAILLVREESGKAPPELIQLDELVGSIGSELRDQDLDVTETTTEPVKVRASRLTLNRALRNLIINAVDAMKDGGEIIIDCSQVGESIIITVSDTGSGIPEEIRANVFNPFFTTKENRNGGGLGLYIVYNEISKLNGKITVESEIGVGTTFTILLPVKRGEESHE
jgi:signal transduction histidine kinase